MDCKNLHVADAIMGLSPLCLVMEKKLLMPEKDANWKEFLKLLFPICVGGRGELCKKGERK